MTIRCAAFLLLSLLTCVRTTSPVPRELGGRLPIDLTLARAAHGAMPMAATPRPEGLSEEPDELEPDELEPDDDDDDAAWGMEVDTDSPAAVGVLANMASMSQADKDKALFDFMLKADQKKAEKKRLRSRWIGEGKHKAKNNKAQPFLRRGGPADSPGTKKKKDRACELGVDFLAARKACDDTCCAATPARPPVACTACAVQTEVKEFAETVFDGDVANEFRREGFMLGQLDEDRTLEAIDLNPCSINLGAIDVLYDVQPKLPLKKGAHQRVGPIMSSSGLTKKRRLLNEICRGKFGISFDDVDLSINEEDDDDICVDGATLTERTLRVVESELSLKQYWRFTEIKTFLTTVLEMFGVSCHSVIGVPS